ncbi:MAG: ankyrin repeat domain-containing protein [Leptospirales bacterium]|nr:ankyrin repeat domain-containing protein [Leptospirales bacterium]
MDGLPANWHALDLGIDAERSAVMAQGAAMYLIDALRKRRAGQLLFNAIELERREQFQLALQRLEQFGMLKSPAPEALHLACRLGSRVAYVQALLSAGFLQVIDQPDRRGYSALHMAVECGDLETTQLLLEAGANPNARDHEGVTPLMLSRSYSAMAEISSALLAAGGDPSLVDKNGKSYLM